MKITTLNVVMFSVGGILIYSGIKAYNPKDVILWGLGGKKPTPFNKKSDPMGKPEDNPDPGQRHPGDKFYPPGTENGGEPTTPASYPA